MGTISREQGLAILTGAQDRLDQALRQGQARYEEALDRLKALVEAG